MAGAEPRPGPRWCVVYPAAWASGQEHEPSSLLPIFPAMEQVWAPALTSAQTKKLLEPSEWPDIHCHSPASWVSIMGT